MEKSVGCEDDEIWGTWEDLLVVCAVHRHGSNDWESVTMEVRNRSRCSPDVLNAQGCKRRYYDLRRRFMDGEVEGGDGDDRRKKDASTSPEIPWLEELRKLRVAELRREVQRYDVSIVSLQSKLKRLTEERERSVSRREEDVVGDGKADLVESVDKGEDQRAVSPQADVAGDLTSGDRPGRSCNESNSPESKGQTRQPEVVDVKMEETVEAEKPDLTPGGENKIAGEESCNGSTDSLAKVRITEEEEEDCRTKVSARPPESGESMAESKGDPTKENSDVQSSASLSKKKRGHRRKATISGCSSAGDSPEADELSPISRDSNLKSQPLAAFLEIIRSQFSIFERRVEIQESARYRSMIRQHIDLEAIRSKLEGSASYANIEFFRDLLLLCNNAVVFFAKDTSEFSAAARLREVINKEISANKNYKVMSISAAATKKPTTTAPSEPPPIALLAEKATAQKLKSEVEAENPMVDKLTTTGPIPLLACRKRSSISAKVAASAVVEMIAAKEEEEEKPDLEKELEDKKSRERPVARGLRTTKSRGAAIRKRLTIESSSNPEPDPIRDSTPEPTKPSEKKNGGSGSNNATAEPLVSNAKKRSAANFLDRLKKSTLSPGKSGSLLQTLKESGGNACNGGGKASASEQKKGGKGDGRKEQSSSRQTTLSKQPQEASASAKRSVGRPPKRPLPPTPPSQPPSKKAREAEKEVSPLPPPRNRKRGKR